MENRLPPLGKEILAVVVSGTDMNVCCMSRYWKIYFYIQCYFLQAELRLLIKSPRLFSRFRYFSCGVNHDSMSVCTICVVVCIIETAKCSRQLAGRPRNRGMISSWGAEILSSSPRPERLWWGPPGVKLLTYLHVFQRVGTAVSLSTH
jgi:hypothetical protein